jgi:hypothetical protein
MASSLAVNTNSQLGRGFLPTRKNRSSVIIHHTTFQSWHLRREMMAQNE